MGNISVLRDFTEKLQRLYRKIKEICGRNYIERLGHYIDVYNEPLNGVQ